MTAVAHDILGAEIGAIGEVLEGAATEEFERGTPLPGWNVRDVIGHCGSVLTRLRDQNLLGFTPEDNENDVVVRRDWSLDDVVTEYLEGLDGFLAMAEAAPSSLDGLARGMWIHGGDIRAGLGRDEFTRRWCDGHTPLSLEIHPLWYYQRNIVCESVTDSADEQDGIVLEACPTRSDLLNPSRFFGGPLMMVPNMLRVAKDISGFLDMRKTETFYATDYHMRSCW